jgi:hypothetical protein
VRSNYCEPTLCCTLKITHDVWPDCSDRRRTSATLTRFWRSITDNPWDWHYWRDRHCRHRPGPEGIPLGSRLAAWIGLVPRQGSTGGKQKLGPISKQGDHYLRRMLVVGAHAVLKLARQQPEKYPWLTRLLARRPFRVVAVALANKMARIAWALLAKGGTYRMPVLAAAA